MRISVDSWNPDWVYTVNCKSRSSSVLCIGIGSDLATLKKCDFYRILTGDTIRAHSLLVHICTRALTVVKFSTAHAVVYTV